MAGLEGQTLGRYELQRLIGRGGMADVYEGYDPHFDRQVAVKVFKREDEEMLRRFIKEAQLMAKLRNEHLVRIFDTGEGQIGNDTRYYIVMPFMEGGTLRARIRRSPLSLTEACHYLRDVADALDYIHNQGIVHRDIKASNVLLDAEGRCYLSDFGIARISTDATQLTSTGDVLGTVDYVAPELFEVNRRADARSDLYSLGVLLFEMVTGQLPFAAENQIALVAMHMHKRPPSPRSISPEVSPQVERVVFKALEKKPEQRYGSATELAEAFCHAVAVGNKGAMVGGEHTSKQRLPEVAAPLPGSDKLVLPPVRTTVPGASRLRPAPLSSSTETVPFVAPRSVAPPVSPPTPIQPREGRRPPVPPTRRRSRGPGYRFWTPVIVALLCIAIIGVGIYAAIHSVNNGNNTTGATATQTQGKTTSTVPTPTPTATPNLTATAQAVAAITATAHAQATVSAIAHATATARARASATAGVIQTATAGKPSYQDALNDPNNANTQAAQWDGLNGGNSHCSFQSDGYHVEQDFNLLVKFRGCRESGNTYKNATVSVDVNIVSGYSGGLFFRVTTDTFGNYSGYLFEIDSQGNYKISAVTGGSLTALQGHDWTPSSALKQGNKNTLQVIIRDDSFLFYANGIFLTQVKDTTYTDGDIGFFASTTTVGTKADIAYSNLKVYSLS